MATSNERAETKPEDSQVDDRSRSAGDQKYHGGRGSQQQARGPESQKNANTGSGRGEHDSFHETLAEELHARSSQSQTDRRFLLSLCGTRYQQPGNIHASDQQH